MLDSFLEAIDTLEKIDQVLVRLQIIDCLRHRLYAKLSEALRRNKIAPILADNRVIKNIIVEEIDKGVSERFIVESLALSIIGSQYDFAEYQKNEAPDSELTLNAIEIASQIKDTFSEFIFTEYLNQALEANQ